MGEAFMETYPPRLVSLILHLLQSRNKQSVLARRMETSGRLAACGLRGAVCLVPSLSWGFFTLFSKLILFFINNLFIARGGSSHALVSAR